MSRGQTLPNGTVVFPGHILYEPPQVVATDLAHHGRDPETVHLEKVWPLSKQSERQLASLERRVAGGEDLKPTQYRRLLMLRAKKAVPPKERKPGPGGPLPPA